MQEIYKRDGGIWPDPQFIEQTLTTTYQAPRIDTLNDGRTILWYQLLKRSYANDLQSYTFGEVIHK